MGLREKVKRVVWRFRSAVTGRFMSREEAEENPREAVRERQD